MEKRSFNQKARLYPITILALIFFLFFLISFYISRLSTVMNQEIKRYLSEIALHVSTLVNYKIDNTYKNMEIIADTYLSMDEDGGFDYLKRKAQLHGFLRFGVGGLDGYCHTTNNYLADLSGESWYQDALRGKNMAAVLHASPVDGRDVITYAVPIRKNVEIIGVLTAAADKSRIQSLLNVETFGGEGYSIIIDRRGNFIAESDNSNAQFDAKNIFDVLKFGAELDKGYTLAKLRADLEADKSGSFGFVPLNGEHLSVTYMPLKSADWYLVTLVPSHVTQQQANLLLKLTVFVCAILCSVFAVLLWFIRIQHRKNRAQLETIAFVDPVTGGYSRARFELEAKEKIQNSFPGSYALVSLDIEKFKIINDVFGSEDGDRTLNHVYHMISTHLFEGELASRVSADTFHLLLRNMAKEMLSKRLMRLAEDINSYNEALQTKYFLTIIVGVYPIDDISLSFMHIQDRANTARKYGKGVHQSRIFSCAFYSDCDRMRLIREKEIENRMESALLSGEFIVYYQPKYELVHESIAGAEALVRWQDPERGLIPPDEFVPILERNGFIVQVDLFVFETVCRLLHSWIENGFEPVPISVNLSRVHLENPDFLKEYVSIFEKYQVPASLIEIELTETLIFENLKLLINVVEQIHEIGFSCSLDDFGSGYSSLNMLKDIQVDVLKLDRAFFKCENEKSCRSNAVIQGVLNLAQNLNMRTVAEGVESKESVQFLRSSHCDMIQGYVFSRPVPVKQFETMLFKKSGLDTDEEGHS